MKRYIIIWTDGTTENKDSLDGYEAYFSSNNIASITDLQEEKYKPRYDDFNAPWAPINP